MPLHTWRAQGQPSCAQSSAMWHYIRKWLLCKCGEESGATAFCSESNQEGTNILVVEGTTHTGMKDIRTKATKITLASLGVGQFKKSLKKN